MNTDIISGKEKEFKEEYEALLKKYNVQLTSLWIRDNILSKTETWFTPIDEKECILFVKPDVIFRGIDLMDT